MKFTAVRKLLYVITPGEMPVAGAEERLFNIARLAVELEIPLMQLRERSLTTSELCRVAEGLVALTRGTQTRLLVNDRADVAEAVRADGVHLTSGSLTAKTVRTFFPRLLIGVSTHDEAELAAASDMADFAVFGPVFDTPGKCDPAGLGELSRLCGMFPHFPVLGLGGISEDNLEEVCATRAAGAAAIRLLSEPATLRSAASKLGYGK